MNMVDSLGIGSLAASIMTWVEARKQRRLLEMMALSHPVVAAPTRKPVKRKRTVTAATAATKAAAEERRRQKLQLERDRHEWSKKVAMANGVKWIFEQMREDKDDEE